MIRFIKETLLLLLFLFGITYLIFSFGNGSFDFTTWVKDSQYGLSTVCVSETLCVFVVQFFRYV